MCGHIIIDANNPSPPPIFDKCKISYSFLNAKDCKKHPFKPNEIIRVNIGSFKMKAEIINVNIEEYNGILCVLEAPICARIGDKVGICRQTKDKEWSFVGGGIIRCSKNIKIKSDQEKLSKLKSMNDKPIITVNNNDNDNNQNEQHLSPEIPKSSKSDNGKTTSPSSTSTSTSTKPMKLLNDNNKLSMNDDKEKIHIRYQQRNGKKGLTTITGLPLNVNFNKLLTKMKKKWSTGGNVVNDAEMGKIMQIQGDNRDKISLFLTEMKIVEKSQITIHGF